MELLQLRYFAESAETENFSVVANKYLVPVSSVSASIRKLEKELGCSLFDREKNRLTLNKNGRLFYNDVNTALNLISSAAEKVSPENHKDLGHINLLIRNNKTLINEKLISFIKENKNISFHINHKLYEKAYNDYDIIVDDLSTNYKGYRFKPIIKEKILIVASKSNPLCRQSLILTDLKHYPIITMGESMSTGKIAKSVCQNAGFNPNIVIEDDSNDIIKYVEEDFGVAFVSENFLKKYPTDKIGILNVTDFDYSRITYIYIRNSIKISEAAKKFFDYTGEIG